MQPKECQEHHSELKESIHKIDCLLFGDKDHVDETPLIVKVNTMYTTMYDIKRAAWGLFFTIIPAILFTGQQLLKLETTYTAINEHLKQAQQFEIRLARLEVQLKGATQE